MGNFFMVDLEHEGQPLEIHQGTLEYLSNVDSRREWDNRGFKATGYRIEESTAFQRDVVSDLEEFIESHGESDVVSEFIEQSLDVYDAIYEGDYESVRSRLGVPRVIFVTGAPRTGGTYLLKELMKIGGADIREFNHKLMSDPVPKEHVLMPDRRNEPQLVFEWAQWVVWTSEVFEDGGFLPKKNIGIGLNPNLIDTIFGELAEYVVTIRHPAEAYKSFQERFLPESGEDSEIATKPFKVSVPKRTSITEDQWQTFSLPEKFLLYWCAIYLELFNSGFIDRITGLPFGEAYEKYLNNFRREYEVNVRIDPFDPTPRDEHPPISNPCREVKRQVEQQWEEIFGSKPYERTES